MRKRKIQPPGWFMLFAWNHSRRMIDYARMMHETCIWHAHKPCSMHDSWCSHQIRLTNDSCCVHDSSCLNEVMVQSCSLCVHNSWLWHDLHDNVFHAWKVFDFFWWSHEVMTGTWFIAEACVRSSFIGNCCCTKRQQGMYVCSCMCWFYPLLHVLLTP